MLFKKYRLTKLAMFFAAHAPEPPPFFSVEPTSPAPELPLVQTLKEAADQEAATTWIQSQGVQRPANPSPDMLGFMASYERAVAARLKWQQEQQERLYFSWRIGYAAKMVAAFRAFDASAL